MDTVPPDDSLDVANWSLLSQFAPGIYPPPKGPASTKTNGVFGKAIGKKLVPTDWFDHWLGLSNLKER